MTVETKTNLSDKSAMRKWAPKAQRQGERDAWMGQAQPPQVEGEVIFPPISPPPVWPRIFPSL